MTNTTDARGRGGAGALTYTTILRLFLPLSLSDVIMVLAGPILTIGLTKLAHPETSLAAYSVALNVAILLESPIIMLLHASNLLSRYRETYQPLRHFMLWANALLTVLYALLAFTPAYDVIFRTLLGQPDAIADAARPAFQALLLWPAAIGWRRFYQGILIQHKRSSVVAYAGFGRIGSLAAVTALGVAGNAHGATLAGVALVISVIVEAVAVTWLARPVLKGGVTDPNAEVPDWAPRTIAQIARWYWPLAMTQILVTVVRPLINGGIARSVNPELGLAAWPVAWSTILMVANSVRMVQQVALTLLQDRRSYLMLRRFTLTVGVAACGIMALLAVTPLGPAVHGVGAGAEGRPLHRGRRRAARAGLRRALSALRRPAELAAGPADEGRPHADRERRRHRRRHGDPGSGLRRGTHLAAARRRAGHRRAALRRRGRAAPADLGLPPAAARVAGAVIVQAGISPCSL